jgi:ElaB/YqjD/DUF883 family membrane-anchored ribosome-binding protein
MGEDATEIRREIEATRTRMSDTVDAIGYKADVPSRVRDNVNERIASVKETIHDLGDGAGGRLDQASAAARQTVSMAVENPLGLALGALAVGFLGGLLLPVSDVERERIGPLTDQMSQRAQSVASEAVEAGKSVLNETLSAASQAVQQHGQEIAQHAVGGTPLEQQPM